MRRCALTAPPARNWTKSFTRRTVRPRLRNGRVTELAKLLGIDDARASLGFNYFNEEGEQLLPDAGDFEPVGNGTERKVSQESGPTDLDDILPANPIPLPLDTAGTPDGDESLRRLRHCRTCIRLPLAC